MAKCAARFLKSAKIEVKNRENALSIVYPTTEPGIRKKSDQKQHVIPPYFSPFLLGQKNVKKQIIISDNVLLLYLYLSSVLSLFLSRMKYLNPGFESVVKSYLARRTKTLPRLVVARL